MKQLINIFIAACVVILTLGEFVTLEKYTHSPAVTVRTIQIETLAASTELAEKSQSTSTAVSDIKSTSKIEKTENPAKFISQIRRFGFTN